MTISARAATAKLAFLFLLAQGLAAGAADVQLFAGGGFRAVVTELAPAFERATGHKVIATFDSTGAFERRIKAGESFDVLLIGPELVDSLIKQGKVVSGTNAIVARGGLGVAVKAGNPKPDVGSVDAFKRALLNANSVAYVGEGHSGALFVGLLDRLGIAEQMKPKLKPKAVADVIKAGSSGEADLVVYIVPAILAIAASSSSARSRRKFRATSCSRPVSAPPPRSRGPERRSSNSCSPRPPLRSKAKGW